MRTLFILIAAVAVSFYAVRQMNETPDLNVYRGGDGATDMSANLADYLPDVSRFMSGGQLDAAKLSEQLISAFPEAFSQNVDAMAKDAMNVVASQSHGEILANFDINHQACQACHDAGKRLMGQ